MSPTMCFSGQSGDEDISAGGSKFEVLVFSEFRD